MTDKLLTETGKRVLATDLDGTLIPLDGDEQNRADLRILAREIRDNAISLVFVTGRHFTSVSNAIEESQLPQPDWIICDVGTSILERGSNGEFRSIDAYDEYLQQIISPMPIDALRERLETIRGLRLQEAEKQSRFKLSYYADAKELDRLVDRIQQELNVTKAPYSIIHSVDPFNGDGLIDLLPAEASKAHALQWWSTYARLDRDSIVFAGDSGNDLAALTAGYRAIVVANADHGVIQRAYNEHREAGWKNRLYIARDKATSGVLEGCRWFEMIGHETPLGLELGATPLTINQTHFRVWAPNCEDVGVEIIGEEETKRHSPLVRDGQGYFNGVVSDVSPHARYFYVLDGRVSRPDPASRYQPHGVHSASEIIPPAAFPWTDIAWNGIPKRELIIYELHIGAFTQEGTFRAAINRLPELIDLGVTAVELMPIAQAPGRWNWGYDGVGLFAVRDTYGEPDDFKAFVDACHRDGLAVILDVVYNHLGPEGNYLAEFGPYFSQEHRTPWGEAFNFDGRQAEHVRQFIIENTIRWLEEYHLDGLRLDAVHFMHDDRTPNILAEIRVAVSDYASTANRAIHLIGEANIYDRELLNPDDDGDAFDATWCDCLMHSIYTHALPDLQLSHRVYRGADDLAEVLRHGYLYCFSNRKPERVGAEQRRKNSPNAGDAPIESFVTALQTHDSVGNHPHGKRIHHLTSKSFQKAAAALTLLFPSIPLIFMGEEYASDSLFAFFADFQDEKLRAAVDAGRVSEYPHHVWSGAVLPSDPQAFLSAKCDLPDDRDADMLAWYGNLIKLRKRGLAEGWLSPSRLSVEHNLSLDLFSLHYDLDDGSNITITSRLACEASQSTAPAAVEFTGDILLSSEPIEKDHMGQILLRPNQAVISKCEKE